MKVYRDVLAFRRYRALWLGATLSSIGDSVCLLALIWLLYSGGHSVAEVGWFVAAYTAPVLVGGPLAGLALDRFDRRRLMIVDNIVRASLVAQIPLLHAFGQTHLWEIYAFAVVYGLLKMIPLAGVPTLVPELVPAQHLAAANALESIGYSMSAIIGAGLGGVLVSALGSATTLWLDAASYGAFAIVLLRLGSIGATAEADAASSRSLAEAFRFIVRTRIILATTAMFVAVNVGAGIVEVVMPAYLRRELHAGARAYGIVVAIVAAAGVLAAFLGGVIRRIPLGRAIAIAQILAGGTYAAIAARPGLVAVTAVFAAGSLFLGPLTLWAQTIRMRLIPGEMRGRIFALLRTSMQAAPPIGALVAAPLLARAGWIGVGVTVSALVCLPAAAGLASGWLDERNAVGHAALEVS